MLALLHPRQITTVLGTDIEPAALHLAEQNLALAGREGLIARAADLDAHAERFDKPSYTAAARRLARGLATGQSDVTHAVHRADVFDPDQLRRALDGRRPGVMITGVPYGGQTAWHGPDGASGAAGMLRALRVVLPENAVIAVAVRGHRQRPDDGLRAQTTFRIGTRTVALFRARPAPAH